MSKLFQTALLVLTAASTAQAQAQVAKLGDPRVLVRAAVESELAANRADHTPFTYRDHDITPDHDTLYEVIETPEGNLRRELESYGKPLSPQQRTADDAERHALLTDAGTMQKQRQNDSHDTQQAENFLKLLPVAYIWTITSEHDDLVTLDFKPDPAFTPDSMEDRVLSSMVGQIVIALPQKRIRTFKGTLAEDVKFGYGLFGRLHKGGGFQIERREVVPHHWQITESHVHLVGHALFFKSIGDQEDEVKSEFRVSPAKTLKEAEPLLR